MIKRIAHAPIFWFVLVVVVATALNLHAQSQSADTIYQNQLASCQQGNPLRRGVTLAIGTAAAHANPPSSRTAYSEALDSILGQPFIRSDGSKECAKAVTHP